MISQIWCLAVKIEFGDASRRGGLNFMWRKSIVTRMMEFLVITRCGLYTQMNIGYCLSYDAVLGMRTVFIINYNFILRSKATRLYRCTPLCSPLWYLHFVSVSDTNLAQLFCSRSYTKAWIWHPHSFIARSTLACCFNHSTSDRT